MTITAVSRVALASNRPAGRAPAEGPMALAGASFAAMLHAKAPDRPAPRGTAVDAPQDVPPSLPPADASVPAPRGDDPAGRGGALALPLVDAARAGPVAPERSGSAIADRRTGAAFAPSNPPAGPAMHAGHATRNARRAAAEPPDAGRDLAPADATGRQACNHPDRGGGGDHHDLGARRLDPGSISGDIASATPSPAPAAAPAEGDGDPARSEAGTPAAPDAAALTLALPQLSTTTASDPGAAQVMPARSGRANGARDAGPNRQAQRNIRSGAPTDAERPTSPVPQTSRRPAGPAQVAAQSATAGAPERDRGPSHATEPDSASPAIAGIATAIQPTVVPAAALPQALPASDRGQAETGARATSRVSSAGSARTRVSAVLEEARTPTPLPTFNPLATGRPEADDAIAARLPAAADHAPAPTETLVPIDMATGPTASALSPHAGPGALSPATPSDPGPAAAPAGAPITAPVAAAAAPPQPGPPPLREAHIAAALGDPGFAPAIGTTLAVMARDGVQHARLQLHPAEMGPITVQIAVDGPSARIDFHAAVAETRQALESALPALAGALRETGLTLTGGGVHQQAPGQHGRDPDRPAPGAPGHGRTRSDEAVAAPPRLRPRRGLVDLVA